MNLDKGITAVSEERVKGLYPGLRPLAYRVLEDVKLRSKRLMNLAQTFRSFEAQLALYKLGREELLDGSYRVVDLRQIVTNAKPGISWHCYGLAFDCSWQGSDPWLDIMSKVIKSDADNLWKLYGQVVRSHGLVWGGDKITLVNGVKDRPHAELTYGLTIADASELYQAGGVRAVWTYLDKHRGVEVGEGWKDCIPA